jgi:hypothetical protein
MVSCHEKITVPIGDRDEIFGDYSGGLYCVTNLFQVSFIPNDSLFWKFLKSTVDRPHSGCSSVSPFGGA